MSETGTSGLIGSEGRVVSLVEARRGALLEDLRLHVGIPTGGGHCEGLDRTRELLTARARALGASVEFVAGDAAPDWLYGRRAGGSVPPTAVCRRRREGFAHVLISGHLDTVHDPRGSFRELSVRPGGETATGPGCVDMKGGLVIVLAALEAIEEAGIGASWTLVLNSDEETGSYHSERALRDAAAGHDVGLVVEPALPDGSLVTERLGSGQFRVRAFGREAHVGRDFGAGVSAVTALAQRLVAIAALPDPERGVICNVGPVEGGSATNVVPDRASAWGNVRFETKAQADALEASIRRLGTSGDAMPRVEVLTSFNRPAKPLTPGTERLAFLARGAAEALGQRLGFGKTGGVCDGNILQDAGLATIDTLGVRGGGLHTSGEWIELASLVERCALLALVILRAGNMVRGGASAR